MSAPATETAPHRAQRVVWIECAALLVLGLLIALPLRGHFVRPHVDFFDLYETGAALVRGELPPSFKRAPVYPLLIGAGGAVLRAVGVNDPPGEQVFAEWLNTLLLPLNGVLVFLVGRKWLHAAAGSRISRGGTPASSPAARFGPFSAGAWAVWFLLLPWGAWCTASLLVEPLFITTLLGTVLLADGSRRWPAYLLAGLATLTRYDAAGLFLGLVLVDRLRGVRWRRSAAALGWSLLPLAVWLGLTALTWGERSGEHYVRQIAERPSFDPAGPLRVAVEVCFSPQRIVLPIWAELDAGGYRFAIRAILSLGALGGAVLLLARRNPGAIVAATMFAVYLLVHAVFPFQWPRFGYPLAPLLLIAAGSGLLAGWRALGLREWGRGLRALVAGAVVILGLLPLAAEMAVPRLANSDATVWTALLPAALALPLVILAMASYVRRWAACGRLAVLAGLLLLARIQVRELPTLLGSGREMLGMVNAARWVARETTADETVVSDLPGLFRAYAPGSPRARFVGYDEIRADAWRDVLVELRGRGVRYLVWHDEIAYEHAHPHYAPRWRLERFAPLDDAAQAADAPGVSLAWSQRGRPNVWIYRLDAAPRHSERSEESTGGSEESTGERE